MKFSAVTLVSALAGVASAGADGRTFAVLRFNNKQLTKGRVDPIVSPGKAASHNHVIMGGSNFGLSSTGDDLVNSQCSNAKVKGDFSNYWFPSLYFHDEATGKFESVDVDYVNVYYFFEHSKDKVVEFPRGLQMLSGNSALRTPPATVQNVLDLNANKPIQPVQFTCPRSTNSPPSYPVGSDGTTAGMQDGQAGVGFPDANCDGLYSPLRMDVHFPSCYIQSAGLTNYKNNMAWPHSDGIQQWCDEGQLHVPHLFLEVYWDTPAFAGRWTQGTGKQPFTLSNGDATGYSAHADFMAGWETGVLQTIIDTCDAGDSGMDQCPNLPLGLNTDDCTIPNPFPETVDGILDALPGNNPLSGWQYGAAAPAPAGSNTSPAASNPTTAASSGSGSGSGYDSGNSGAASSPVVVEASPAQTQAAGSAAPAAAATTPAPQGTNNQQAGADCVTEIETVWETVYVTETDAASPTPAAKARRHAHNHAAHLHRHRSFRR